MIESGEQIENRKRERKTPAREYQSLPLCPECEKLPRAAISRARPRQLYAEQEVLAIATTDTTFRHAIAAMVAMYDLPSLIECNAPDKTPHFHGYVLQTRCGITIRLGHICAKGAAINRESIVRLEARERARQRKESQLARERAEIEERERAAAAFREECQQRRREELLRAQAQALASWEAVVAATQEREAKRLEAKRESLKNRAEVRSSASRSRALMREYLWYLRKRLDGEELATISRCLDMLYSGAPLDSILTVSDSV